MMRSRRSAWLSGLGAAVLIGGLILANYGTGVPPAEATGSLTLVNPFKQIVDKLNEILAKLNSGGQEGNHTLRWDQNLPAAQRFVVLASFANAAVLDKNTGLVWEQAPDATARTWPETIPYCVNKPVGGTRGWRLPSVAELASLIDPSLPAPFVPGTVFTGVQSASYWSATTFAGDPTVAWFVFFRNDDVGITFKTLTFHAWCVRGGMQESVY